MQQVNSLRDTVTVVLAGELDHFTAPQIRARLDEELANPAVLHMVLDVSQLTFMDSSGIGVLLGRLRLLQSRGGSLSVTGMQPAVDKLFRLTGMHRVIHVADAPKGGKR